MSEHQEAPSGLHDLIHALDQVIEGIRARQVPPSFWARLRRLLTGQSAVQSAAVTLFTAFRALLAAHVAPRDGVSSDEAAATLAPVEAPQRGESGIHASEPHDDDDESGGDVPFLRRAEEHGRRTSGAACREDDEGPVWHGGAGGVRAADARHTGASMAPLSPAAGEHGRLMPEGNSRPLGPAPSACSSAASKDAPARPLGQSTPNEPYVSDPSGVPARSEAVRNPSPHPGRRRRGDMRRHRAVQARLRAVARRTRPRARWKDARGPDIPRSRVSFTAAFLVVNPRPFRCTFDMF